jgi:hypothetical protein
MYKKKYVLISVSIILTIVIACQASFQTKSATSTPEPTATPILPQPTATEEQPTAPAGWLTYQNLNIGFEISYPPNYEALDDEDSLYGWPNGLLLLYKGGQSYDIAIQIWDSQQDLDANYPVEGDRITTVQSGNKIISIFDVTEDSENAAVIATFHLLP